MITIKFRAPGIMTSEELYLPIDTLKNREIYAGGTVSLSRLFKAFKSLEFHFYAELKITHRISSAIRIEGKDLPNYESLISALNKEFDYYRP